MATYRVVPGSLSVNPTKSSFASGEDVLVSIKCQLQRKDGVGALLAWSSQYKIYKKSGELLKTVTRSHSMAPWTDIDTANDDFTENIGSYTPGLLEGEVVASAFG